MPLEEIQQKIATLAEPKALSTEVVEATPAGEESRELETIASDDVSDAIATARGASEDHETLPAYVPNRAFKVNGEEKQFEPWVEKSLSKETEPKIRELFEKAHGLDVIKPKLAAEREAHALTTRTLNQLHNEVTQTLRLKDIDLGLFFETIKLDPRRVAAWIIEQAEIQALPENQRKAYTDRDDLKRKNLMLELQAQNGERASIDAVVQARTSAVDQLLAQPQLASVVAAYDTRLAKPGAFRCFVMQNADFIWRQSEGKRDLTPQEAVDEALKVVGLTPAVVAAQTTGAPPITATTIDPKKRVIVASKEPETLPKLGNSSGSPVGKKPKSLADLRQMAKESADNG